MARCPAKNVGWGRCTLPTYLGTYPSLIDIIIIIWVIPHNFHGLRLSSTVSACLHVAYLTSLRIHPCWPTSTVFVAWTAEFRHTIEYVLYLLYTVL
jgi:hypothetical protein